MCMFVSAVVTNTGSVYLHISNSHIIIRKEHNLRMSDGVGLDRFQTPVEFYPVTDLFNIKGWKFKFDDAEPDWWKDWMTDKAKREMFRFGMSMFYGKTLETCGDLRLSQLTSIPKGVTLRSGCTLYLDRLTSIPKGVTLKAGVFLNLDKLISIPKDVTLEAGRCMYLSKSTTIPEGVCLPRYMRL